MQEEVPALCTLEEPLRDTVSLSLPVTSHSKVHVTRDRPIFSYEEGCPPCQDVGGHGVGDWVVSQ